MLALAIKARAQGPTMEVLVLGISVREGGVFDWELT
jgi:hypothetical protein